MKIVDDYLGKFFYDNIVAVLVSDEGNYYLSIDLFDHTNLLCVRISKEEADKGGDYITKNHSYMLRHPVDGEWLLANYKKDFKLKVAYTDLTSVEENHSFVREGKD